MKLSLAVHTLVFAVQNLVEAAERTAVDDEKHKVDNATPTIVNSHVLLDREQIIKAIRMPHFLKQIHHRARLLQHDRDVNSDSEPPNESKIKDGSIDEEEPDTGILGRRVEKSGEPCDYYTEDVRLSCCDSDGILGTVMYFDYEKSETYECSSALLSMCSEERRDEAEDSHISFFSSMLGYFGCSPLTCLDEAVLLRSLDGMCGYLNCAASGGMLCDETHFDDQCTAFEKYCGYGNNRSCFWELDIMSGAGASRMPVDGEFCLPPHMNQVASYCPDLVWKGGSGDWCKLHSSNTMEDNEFPWVTHDNGVSHLKSRVALASVAAAATLGGGSWML